MAGQAGRQAGRKGPLSVVGTIYASVHLFAECTNVCVFRLSVSLSVCVRVCELQRLCVSVCVCIIQSTI